MQVGQRYGKLLELAHESSSEKRRELLGEVTDLFFATKDQRSELESGLFGELMAKVAYELDGEVRKDLSCRFQDGSAPRQLAIALAHDEEMDIASPILRHSTSLSQSDLIEVVQKKSDAYRMVITKRRDVTEALSAALVAHGDDNVVASLVDNQHAKLSHETFDAIVERAHAAPALHKPLAERANIPPEHLNQLYFSVDQTLRDVILARNSALSAEEIEAAMARAKVRVGVRYGALPADYESAVSLIETARAKKAFHPHMLPSLWRDKKTTAFHLAFAQLVGLDFHLVVEMFARKDLDGLAMVCRASGFERALFVTIAVLVLGEQGMGQAAKLGTMYHDVPVEAAARALRFMKLRAGTGAAPGASAQAA